MSTTAPIGEDKKVPEVTSKLVPIYVMGKRYDVPDSLTIMKAMEYSGYKFIRGCGCRGGICGACGTVYRKAGDYKLRVGLACQTVVEEGMYLTQIPFYPANRTVFDYEATEPVPEAVFKAYPELFRCVACNACTKICPMDVPVMDYVAAVKRGDFEKATELSFDCIQCGMCASRCMAEMAQYHIAQMVRRIYGGKITPKATHLAEMVDNIKAGRFKAGLEELKKTDMSTLKKLYMSKEAREIEPSMSEDEWTPSNNANL
jgi:succinate dehydrogenase/fumarate reductase-like Fe-S protein